jgi:hypothetical protein
VERVIDLIASEYAVCLCFEEQIPFFELLAAATCAKALFVEVNNLSSQQRVFDPAEQARSRSRR